MGKVAPNGEWGGDTLPDPPPSTPTCVNKSFCCLVENAEHGLPVTAKHVFYSVDRNFTPADIRRSPIGPFEPIPEGDMTFQRRRVL